MTQTIARPTRTTPPPDRTVGLRRVAGALALPLAFVCQLVTNATYAWVSMGGSGDSGSGAEALEFYRTFADEALLITPIAMLGCLLTVPGMLAALRVLRPGAPRLALAAAVGMIAGYVCYFGIVMTNYDTVALARLHPDAGDVIDAGQATPSAMVFFLIFVAGNLIGTALLGVAAVRAGRRSGVPRWAGVLIMGWPVGHLINIVGGGEWFAVAGGALEIAGLCLIAAAAVRTTDLDWAARG